MVRRRWKLDELYDVLFEHYGQCECPLHFTTPFQLLVAVVLSAQCRDERVNMVTPALFRDYPDPVRFGAATAEELEPYLHTLGLYRSKARNLILAAQRIVSEYHGEIPPDMASLVTLPGVGRKSANAILGNAFNLPGFPVDTHVNRVLNRLRLTASRDPEKIELEVTARLAPERWTNFSHLLITLGRNICHARAPECEHCFLAERCPSRSKPGQI